MRIELSSGWIEARADIDLIAISDDDWAFVAKIREMLQAHIADAALAAEHQGGSADE